MIQGKHVERLSIFFQLLRMNLNILLKDIFDSVGDTCIWVGLSVFCNGYIYPVLGMTTKYGGLIAAGHIVSCGIFLSYAAAMVLTSDFKNDRSINYELTLPLPSWLVFFKTALAWAIKAAIISSIILPFSKLILWDNLDLSNFCLGKFLVAFVTINLFVGMFSIFTTGLNKDILTINRVWVRIIYPMWFLGGSIFPFASTIQAFPKLGYLLLLNPITYATELIRASVFGSASCFLPFSVSAIALPFFAVVFFWIGYSRLKHRMDFY